MSNKHPGKQTSAHEASTAGKVLSDPNASARARSLAASALAQVQPDTVTSPEIAALAAKVVHNPNASDIARSLAGTVLAQAAPRK